MYAFRDFCHVGYILSSRLKHKVLHFDRSPYGARTHLLAPLDKLLIVPYDSFLLSLAEALLEEDLRSVPHAVLLHPGIVHIEAQVAVEASNDRVSFAGRARLNEVAQAPGDASAVLSICKGIRRERGGGDRNERNHGGNSEVYPVFGVLDRTAFVAILDHQRGDPFLEGEEGGLVPGIQHRVQTALDKRAQRILGDRQTEAHHVPVTHVRPLVIGCFVVGVDLALVDDRMRVVNGVLIPMSLLARRDNSPVGRRPGPIR